MKCAKLMILLKVAARAKPAALPEEQQLEHRAKISMTQKIGEPA
jgi:hypothetical protein